jgi:septum formation protein
MTLILASASPRRRDLLAQLGLPFEVVVSGIDERIDPDLPPAELAVQLAEAKARTVAATRDDGLVIGGDTVVALGERILGKPRDAEDAAALLRDLRGRVHHVLTGIAVIDAASGQAERGVVRTAVRMRPADDATIARYVATGEPLDKAGGYGIQGGGRALVAAIAGCYTNVVGLPLCELAALLGRFEVAPEGVGPVCLLANGLPCPRLGSAASGTLR